MNALSNAWSDISREGWIDRYIPLRVRPYLRLLRLDRPIGTWLLLLPCWWGLALASPHVPSLLLLLIFAVGSVVMRGAGCIVNDSYDRDLDRQVERTRQRPLASGEIKPWQAFLLLLVMLVVGCCMLLVLNRMTVLLGISSLVLVFTYPLMKRLTWWPQLFLGFTFNWGILMGWTAVRNNFGLPDFLLYIAGIFWTLAYDTIYAHQDKRDDEMVGIKSTALLFGDRSFAYVALFYGLTIFFLLLVGLAEGLGWGFYSLLCAAVLFQMVQLALWHPDDPENCLVRFRRNRDFGLIVFIALLLGKFS